MSFNNLGLQDSLLRAVKGTGYTHPTTIQEQAIPAILTGKDVMAAAQTGTGKTAGFTLPLLQLLGRGTQAKSNHVRALVLTPTRELAAQVEESVRTYGGHERLRSVVVFGGVKINPQLMAMRKGADILVATPGRLLDLYQQNAVNFSDLEVLIMDEADRMLDMGFINDIRRILKLLPKQRQNLMFSATFSNEIRTLAKTICRQPIEIDVAPRNSTVETISQRAYKVNKAHKIPLLITLLKESAEQTLVFSRTKHGANNLVKKLNKAGVSSIAIHGNKSQNQRTKALQDFKANKSQVMVATDIAARGIDIDQLAQVINFDMPHVPEDYVHRIGRTGRAGATGLAMSLVSPDENAQLRNIERLIKQKIELAELPEMIQAIPAVENPANSEKAATEKPRHRRSGNKSKNKTGRTKHPNAASRDAANDDSKSERPKRRRRPKHKNRNKQAATHNQGNDNSTAMSDSTAAKIKRFFSSKKVA